MISHYLSKMVGIRDHLLQNFNEFYKKITNCIYKPITRYSHENVAYDLFCRRLSNDTNFEYIWTILTEI